VNLWIYQGKPLTSAPDGYHGFVYLITNTTGRRYIGRKNFHRHLSKKVPGRKNRVHYVKESDWATYFSSCQELKADVKRLGDHCFTRDIVKLCKTKSELSYSELEALVKSDVLTARLDDGSFAWYNSNVVGRYFRR
jgi:hypothetical protein